jgi:hypothetical protein
MIIYYAEMDKIHQINILILYYGFPISQKQYGQKQTKNKSSLKSALWYATADLIVLKDGIIPCVSNVGRK